MVTLRSRREIDLMRGAGSIVVEAFAEAARVLAPGVSTYEINKIRAAANDAYGNKKR